MLKYFVKSFLAGLLIAMGGVCFLSIENKIVGAFVFALGLFMIVTRGLNLYTGKIGYIIDSDREFKKEVAITLIGNFVGTAFVAFLMRLTRACTAIVEKAQGMCSVKMADGLLSVCILSVFCGILMYLAVDTYKNNKDEIARYMAVFLCVGAFILCGLEHCIANMFYFSIAGVWSMKALVTMMVMILGNSAGSFIFPVAQKLFKDK